MLFIGTEKNPVSLKKQVGQAGAEKRSSSKKVVSKKSANTKSQKVREEPQQFKVKQRVKKEVPSALSTLSIQEKRMKSADFEKPQTPFSVLSNLIDENAHLKDLSQQNRLKHRIREAEDALLKEESTFGEKKSYMLTPDDIKSLCTFGETERDLSKDIVRDFLERRYGKLPSVFDDASSIERSPTQKVSLPYSGSSFSRNAPDQNKLPDPPREWLA